MQMKTRAPVYEGVRPRATTGTVVFVGHARLPQSLAPRDAAAVISIELETDVASGAIVSASVRGVLPLGARLMEEMLAGHNINDGPQGPVRRAAPPLRLPFPQSDVHGPGQCLRSLPAL